MFFFFILLFRVLV